MTRRVVRVVAVVVSCALTLAVTACGGGGGTRSEASDSPDDVISVAEEGASGTGAPSLGDASQNSAGDSPGASADVPALLDGGIVSEAALAAVLVDGEPDQAVLAALAAEFQQLPIDQQEAALAHLAARVEVELAEISGLAAAVGDSATTQAALTGASAQIRAQTDAAVAEAGASIAAASTGPVGLRQRSIHGFAASAAAPSGGSVAAVGLFLGYLGLATFGKTATEASNRFGATDSDVREGDGTVMGASVEEVSAELTFKGTQSGVDVEFVAGAVIHPCPAADGSFSIESLIDVKASKGGVGQNARIELKVDGIVGDDAEIASKTISNHTQWADFGGGKGQFVDFTMSGPTGVETLTANRTGGTVTDGFYQASVLLATLIGLLIEYQLRDAAEQAWKSGRCVVLRVTPSAGPDGLEPSQQVSVLAEPRSKVDGSPTGGTVTASLVAGGQAVEPDGSPVPADADSTYTAPPEQDKQGTVAYESRSRRGIGKAQVTFSTSKPAAYLVVGGLEDWQVNMVVCDITKPFTLESPGVGVAEFSGGLSGTYSATGVFNFQYQGTYQVTLENGLGTPGTMIATSGGSIAGEAGFGSENYVLTPATC